MPMPRLVVNHQRKIATKSAFQVKKKIATRAPMWNRTMNEAVTQLTPSRSALCFLVSVSSCEVVIGSNRESIRDSIRVFLIFRLTTAFLGLLPTAQVVVQ